LVGPGDYVLVRKPGGGGQTVTVLLGILAVPAILVVALVVLRLRSGPGPDEDESAGDGNAPEPVGSPVSAGRAGGTDEGGTDDPTAGRR
jgi:hypothetical protein